MGALVRVVDDLFHIARRIREIDCRYEIYFNRVKSRFEIHANGAMQIALPFGNLDNRTLIYVRETRLERLDNVISDIEKHNSRLDKINEQASFERNLAQMEAVL